MYCSISLGPPYGTVLRDFQRYDIQTGLSANLTRNSILNSSYDGGPCRYLVCRSRYQTRASSIKSAEMSAIFLLLGVSARKNRSSIMVIQALTFSVYLPRKIGNLTPVRGLYDPFLRLPFGEGDRREND